MLNFFDSVSCETIIAENEAYEQVLAMVRLRLEQVIRAFMYATKLDRFKMFKENVRSAFVNSER